MKNPNKNIDDYEMFCVALIHGDIEEALNIRRKYHVPEHWTMNQAISAMSLASRSRAIDAAGGSNPDCECPRSLSESLANYVKDSEMDRLPPYSLLMNREAFYVGAHSAMVAMMHAHMDEWHAVVDKTEAKRVIQSIAQEIHNRNTDESLDSFGDLIVLLQAGEETEH